MGTAPGLPIAAESRPMRWGRSARSSSRRAWVPEQAQPVPPMSSVPLDVASQNASPWAVMRGCVA